MEYGQEGEKQKFPSMLDGRFCSEARSAISHSVRAALRGGSLMHGWRKNEKAMIACCNDGTRPVIFQIERPEDE